MFDHEKFEAYQLAISYWESTFELLNKLPAGNYVIKDQLKRVSSIILK